MAVLIAGLAIFIAVHLSPNVPTLRNRLVTRFGEAEYKVAFSALTLVAFGLIVIGKREAEWVYVWLPPVWLHLFILPILFVAFYCLAAAYVPSNLPRFTRHPMLWGVALWAIAHLLVNNDLASMTIFAALGGYALIAMLLANMRGVQKSNRRYPWTFESMPIAIGGILLIVSFMLHRTLFGVPAGMHG